MNDHLKAGLEALSRRDWPTAEASFQQVLDDSQANEIAKRAAQNRLDDLKHRRVYGCQQSWLYHRANCPAENGAKWLPIWFELWRDAEADGRTPCPQCKPQRLFNDVILR